MLGLGMLPLDYGIASTPVAFYALGCSICDFANGSFHRVLGGGASGFGYDSDKYDQKVSKLLTRAKAYAAAGACMLLESVINQYTGIPTRFGLAFFVHAATS